MRQRGRSSSRLFENAAFAVFTLIGFAAILYDLFGGSSGDDYGAWGMACLAWAKAFEVSLRLRDHRDGRDDD